MREDNSYQLLIYLKKARRIQVGALGRFHFAAGYYLYSGSAKRNLQARLARHCRRDKPLRWHIDYLTSLPQATVVETRVFHDDECRLHQGSPGEEVVPGFGASDCSSGCGAHLKYLGTSPVL